MHGILSLVTFGLIARVVVLVVGDIHKLATETIQFGLGSILINFVLPGNLWNTIRWYQFNAMQWTTIRVTLNKSAWKGSMLRAGIFLESEGAGQLEWLCDCIHGGLISPLYIPVSQCLLTVCTCKFLTKWHMPTKQSVGLQHWLWTPMPRLCSKLTCTKFSTNVTLSNTF